MNTVEADKSGFVFDEETISCFDVKKGKYVVQATLNALRLIESATVTISTSVQNPTGFSQVSDYLDQSDIFFTLST
jgi:hypothetical protein